MIEEILSKQNMTYAYKQVVSNKGSAGVDKMKVSELKSYLQKHWERIKTEVKQGIYQPQQVWGLNLAKRYHER